MSDDRDAAQPPKAAGGVAPAGVDPHVLSAARQLSEIQRSQPEWLWFTDDKTDSIPVARYSFGRWAKVEGQAPYIRADLALAAAPPLNTGPEVGGGGDDLLTSTEAVALWEAEQRLSPAPADAGEDLAGLSAREVADYRTLLGYLRGEGAARYGHDGAVIGDSPAEVAIKIMRAWDRHLQRNIPAASRPVEQGEPVAWAYEAYRAGVWVQKLANKDGGRPAECASIRNVLPLYAHPAPAASRPAAGREEIADAIADAVMSMRWVLDASDKWGSAFRRERDERRVEVRKVVLALLDPRDDTRAGGTDLRTEVLAVLHEHVSVFDSELYGASVTGLEEAADAVVQRLSIRDPGAQTRAKLVNTGTPQVVSPHSGD